MTVTTPGTYTYGESLTYQATVTGVDSSTDGEMVSFTVGSTTLCSGPLSSGIASCSSTLAPGGSDTVTATYMTDGNFDTSSGTYLFSVGLVSTSTSVSVTTTGSYTYGESLTYQVTVTGVDSSTDGEMVSFTVGSTTLCSGPLSSGIASCSSTLAPGGSDTVTATYMTDGNFDTSSGTYLFSVGLVSTSTSVSVTTTGSYTYGESLTYQVTVTGSPGTYSESPSGSVSLTANGTELCTVNLTAVADTNSTTGSCQSAAAPGGSDTVTASYQGDPNYSSSSGTTPITVGTASTSTSVSVTTTGSYTYGESLNYQATVTGVDSSTNGETVSFAVGSTTLCSGTLSSGTASCSSSKAPVGSDTVTASYQGDPNYSSSSGTTPIALGEATTTPTVSVTTKPTTYTYGESLTYQITVTANPAGSYQASPSGIVTVSVSGTALCTAQLTSVANTNATTGTCSSTDAPAGSDTLSAYYYGDTNFQPSSGTETATVAKASTSTSVTFGPSTIGYGTGVTYSVTVQPGSSVNLANSENYPTGDVDIFVGPASGVGDIEVCQAPLDPGLFQGTCVGTTAPVGSDKVTATYDGDPNFDGSAPFTAATTLTVNKGSQTISFIPPSSGTVGDTVDPVGDCDIRGSGRLLRRPLEWSRSLQRLRQ